MCGIVGIISQGEPVDRNQLARMRDTMQHRGPDDAGMLWLESGRVGLAQRRLAIIDLSPGGHQPMTDGRGELHIVFNGEIYNYRELREELQTKGHVFRSLSDTEVILEGYRAWGTDCAAHFNGMFAFAIYDGVNRRLFLSRDRAGEKPLFYGQYDDRFVFASELKALMADPRFERRLQPDALEYYLAFGYVPGDMCILRAARKLPPAHSLVVDVDTFQQRLWRYWEIPQNVAAKDADLDELTDQVEGLLADSVKRQLVADVPVGILLSGGVDSSLVTAMAARATSAPIRTFTISFPGSGVFDESSHARLVARHFGTEHVELAAEPATLELLPLLASQYDEPICDSSMIPTYLVSRLIRQHATVALGGDGGDELFGGYLNYQRLIRQHQLLGWIPAAARTMLSCAASNLLPLGLWGRGYLMGLAATTPQAVARSTLCWDSRFRQRVCPQLQNRRGGRTFSPESYKTRLCQRQRGLPGSAMAVDFQTYLCEDILVKVDRASMLSSLEVRAPFLDYRIVEFAFSKVPNQLYATSTKRKILLRRLAERLLPRELDVNRKQGFSIPLARWFDGKWGDYFAQVLGETDSALFDRRVVQSLLTGQRRGRNNTTRLFMLTMFELWRRKYRVATA